jgi:hypothetical protein
MCHLLECSALQYCCIEDIVSENPIMTVPVTKVACVIQRYARVLVSLIEYMCTHTVFLLNAPCHRRYIACHRCACYTGERAYRESWWHESRGSLATRIANQIILVGAEHECEPRQADDRAGQVGEAWQEE